MNDAFEFDPDMALVVKVAPEDQLDLTPEELEKEVPPRVLHPHDPHAPDNITQFSFKDRVYKPDNQVDHTAWHLAVDGVLMLSDSPEAQEEDDTRERKAREQEVRDSTEAVDVSVEHIEGDPDPAVNTLRNQFHFADRGSQTKNGIIRDRGISTEPPSTTTHNETVTQWSIYDHYMKDIEATKDKAEGTRKLTNEDMIGSKKPGGEADPLYGDPMRLVIKIMERMVNHNAEEDIYSDLKYWEDRSDDYREGDGTLLPLWRFASEKAKRKQVTCIRCNPKYSDLFAVGFGSYDFLKQGTGVICCYSIKNTRFPEYVFNTDSGVCCLDWHPSHPAMLAIGLYDGTVLVHDVRSKGRKPLYQSTIRTNKHTDPVWEVHWNTEDSAGVLNFFSISADGRVSIWRLMKDKLESEQLMQLKIAAPSPEAGKHDSQRPAPAPEDDTGLAGLAGGLCFDFHLTIDHLFLIGTEEGKIHKCSKDFSGQYLATYEGHTMAVYTVRWNNYHPRMFISASADWTVKLWDHTQESCLMSFDLGQAVGDVAWAPYSSTAFAAITSDGIVHFYDLSVNRNERICYQKVVRKAKLTHIMFNTTEPIIFVGDDRGGVNCLKLSPNLRKFCVVTEEDGDVTREELEVRKMNEFLEMAVGPQKEHAVGAEAGA
ncbi:hypothetical protein FOZ60_014767 [Perkinsus olseni]|uniref:Dynein intermediate chain 1, axonemal n=2 Tax=Perkinsus olseni TaxID=32597 RepID=A0A7J6N6Y4_PEROL|nr:hypothetical protein FOZ60_014767 [Perkinsus olseni]